MLSKFLGRMVRGSILLGICFCGEAMENSQGKVDLVAKLLSRLDGQDRYLCSGQVRTLDEFRRSCLKSLSASPRWDPTDENAVGAVESCAQNGGVAACKKME